MIETIKKGVLRYRTPLEKLTSGFPKGSPSRPERCLNANRQSDSFMSLEIAPRNSNHIPGGTRYCCKSLFAQVTKNSPGRRRDIRVKMWGTSSPDGKLAGDLGNVFEGTRIGGRQSNRLMAGKSSPGDSGLLQQNRHRAVTLK